MRPNTKQILSAVDASEDQESEVIPAAYVVQASVQIAKTGTATGDVNLMVSNDEKDPTNWSEVATVALADAGVYLIPKTDLCYKWLKVQFVADNEEDGTLTVNLNTIGLN